MMCVSGNQFCCFANGLRHTTTCVLASPPSLAPGSASMSACAERPLMISKNARAQVVRVGELFTYTVRPRAFFSGTVDALLVLKLLRRFDRD
ncbi:hypothetical protein BaRGS_00025052 [Batillaria attramentaria]|uniref:Secreted protein n=1 Tax=Batillaria attramentaria TaxID=370345 RepID=A0ABD0K9C9_9CAEN